MRADFNTVKHDNLLRRLNTTSADWLRTFSGRADMMVAMGSDNSICAPVPFGVPQSSVLGSVLYSLY